MKEYPTLKEQISMETGMDPKEQISMETDMDPKEQISMETDMDPKEQISMETDASPEERGSTPSPENPSKNPSPEEAAKKSAKKEKKRYRKGQKALKAFCTEYHRLIEEGFAQLLSEQHKLRLFFIGGQGAFTDGQNIMVDPSGDQLYMDGEALQKTQDYLGLDRSISSDPYLALRMVTRAQNIHETLHILYSEFPPRALADPRGHTPLRKKTLALLDNIIEDAFIEGAGCSLFDNLEHFLLWHRVASCFAKKPDQGTVEQVLGGDNKEDPLDPDAVKLEALMAYLEYMAVFLLYPMIRQEEPKERIAGYVEKTKTLFRQGSICPDPPGRYQYAQQIFDIIEDLIPKTGTLDHQFLKPWLEGLQTHDVKRNSSLSHKSPGQPVLLQRLLFTDVEGKILPGEGISPGEILWKSPGEKGPLLIWEKRSRQQKDMENPSALPQTEDAAAPREEADSVPGRSKRQESILVGIDWKSIALAVEKEIRQFRQEKKHAQGVIFQGSLVEHTEASYDCAKIHRGMRIQEIKPACAVHMKKAWQNRYQKHRLGIMTWSSRFAQLLQVESEVREDKQRFGTTINSRRLGDVKKRFWYRHHRQEAVADLGVLLLIDGSGSMEGERKEGAMIASLILHEVLKKNAVPHAIVEHRAIYDKYVVHHRILVDFQSREEEKYNLLTLGAYEGTREGLSLYWAEHYLQERCSAEHKLILIISDGLPAHSTGEGAEYYPPVSTADTANAVGKIRRRGTAIVAIALDAPGEEACFQDLKEIYPDTVSCSDISRLASRLLKVIARKLNKAH